MDFGEVLTRTWQITWKYKGLWVLGLLAGCGTGGGGGGGGGGSSGGNYSGGNYNGPMQQFQQGIQSVPVWVWVLLAIVLLLLVVVFIVLGVIGTGGLIAGFKRADEGHDIRLSEAFRLGVKYFWRLLGFRLVLFVLVIALAVVIAAVAVGSLGLCLLPLICIGLPLFFAIGVYISLCQVALIDEDLPVTQVFGRAWEILRLHLVPAALMGLILGIGGFVVALVMALPIFLILIPFLVTLASRDSTAMTTGAIISGVCFVGYLPVLLLLNAVLQTYLNGAWTLTYRRLTGKGPGATAAVAEVSLPPTA